MNQSIKLLTILIGWIGIFSCDQDSSEKVSTTNLNSFEMTVDGNQWSPSIISPCERTYSCAMSEIDSGPFYKIEAYKDPQAVASLNSENFFEIKVMNVDHAGVYFIDGIFHDFDSYARFRINRNNETKIYQNKENSSSFFVEVTELLPIEYTDVVGIKGFFSGTLYNNANHLDSLVIKNGEFVFQKTNRSNFNQCKE